MHENIQFTDDLQVRRAANPKPLSRGGRTTLREMFQQNLKPSCDVGLLNAQISMRVWFGKKVYEARVQKVYLCHDELIYATAIENKFYCPYWTEQQLYSCFNVEHTILFWGHYSIILLSLGQPTQKAKGKKKCNTESVTLISHTRSCGILPVANDGLNVDFVWRFGRSAVFNYIMIIIFKHLIFVF